MNTTKGEAHHNWKGDKADPYQRVHRWLRSNFGRASKCESTTCSGISIRSDYKLNVDVGRSLPKLKKNEYQCENCLEIYEKGWSDKEAMAETEGYFGKGWEQSELAIICDDCFNKMHPQNHPDKVADAKAEKEKP